MSRQESTPSGFSKKRIGYLAGAVVLALAALASQFQLDLDSTAPSPTRVADVSTVESLSDREDLNLLLIIVDTLRADRLGSYGHTRATSPNLDALAARGIRFANVEAQSSWTKASMASFWTGWLPERTGISRHDHALAEEVEMPAELLREEGMRTIGIWRNGWLASTFGFAQGFDLYIHPAPGVQARRAPRQDLREAGLHGTDADLTAAAVDFLRGVEDERFFLYLHFMDVHQYVSDRASPSFGTGFADLYDASIHWVDSNVGVVIAMLEARDLLDRTVIVVAADHGEALGEDGREGHARSLHTETQHTPLIVGLPDALATSLVVDTPVANVDVWPTLLRWMGVEVRPPMDGRDLTPTILAAARGGEIKTRELVSQLDTAWGRADRTPRPIAALRDGDERLLLDRTSGAVVLYDRATDSYADADRATQQPDRAQALRARLESILVESRRQRLLDPVAVSLEEGELSKLRALGYVVAGEKEANDVPQSVGD